jgi:ribose 5-phosphate isomerase B
MSTVNKIAIGSDHRGFTIKQALIAALKTSGRTVEDKGPHSQNSVDYPEFARKVAISVASGESSCGILICGSGIGMSITANKFRGIRAALCHDIHSAEMCRRHNDANILVLGEAVGTELAQSMLKVWLETSFEAARHKKRISLIEQIEKENFKV